MKLRFQTGLAGLLGALLAAAPAVNGLAKDKKKPPKAAPMTEAQKAEHVLNRLGYGPRPGDIERVRKMGVKAYIEQQLQPEKINDSALEARLEPLSTLRMSNEELTQNFPQAGQLRRIADMVRSGQQVPPRARELYDRFLKDMPLPAPGEDPQKMLERLTPAQRRQMMLHSPQRITLELQQAKLVRAAYSERQLYEQMVDFWMNHFNVYMAKGADRWLVTGYERDAIRPHAMGKFKDLVLATARHPAMLFYLDNFQSAAPNSPGGRGLNENYARELMELHTLGVDGGYSQKDVVEVARCFTGWSIRRPRDGAEYLFNPRMHDRGEKTVLGVKIPAGGGEEDGLKVIDMLVNHPSTARFVATKLARRFVADQPPEAVVNRAAQAFTKSGGDIPETLRAIFASPEFFSGAAYRAKVKKPIELVASALRASGAEIGALNFEGGYRRPDGEGRPAEGMMGPGQPGQPGQFGPPGPGGRFAQQLSQALARLGEPLYLCEPPTGYPDVAEAWINTGLMLNRVNFAMALATGQVPNVRVKPEVVSLNSLGEKTRAALKSETEPARIAGLILGSPEFQRR